MFEKVMTALLLYNFLLTIEEGDLDSLDFQKNHIFSLLKQIRESDKIISRDFDNDQIVSLILIALRSNIPSTIEKIVDILLVKRKDIKEYFEKDILGSFE